MRATTLRFATGSAERLRIDSSGRLLLACTTPPNTGVNAGLQIQHTSTANITLARNDSSITDGNALGRIDFYGNDGGTFEHCATIAAQADGAHAHGDKPMRLIFGTSADGAATPTERLRIDSSGRIGVGVVPTAQFAHNLIQIGHQATLGANAALSTTGQTFLTHNLYFDTSGNFQVFNTSNANEGAILRLVDGQLRFSNSDATTGTPTVTERLRLNSSGQLLLGTTTEGYNSADNFTIADTGNCGLTIRSATNGLGTIAFSDATSGTGEYSGFIQYNQANRHLTFGTESDEHVRIDNNGHLEVDYDSDNNARVQFGFATGVWITANSSDGHQRFYTNQAERIRSGYNGQGTEFSNQNSVRPGADNSIDLGSGSYRYDDVYATNGTIQTSDSRLKQEVVTSVLGIDFIKALRPVSYKWIEGKKVPIVDGTDENGDNIYRADADGNWVYNSRSGARRHWGFIAQEVKQAVDDAGVDFAGWSLADKDDPDSRQSLRYEEFIAPLTKALQEAIAKIETLETQNADLLARVTALEGS